VKELESQRKNLNDEINNLRAQKYNLENQLHAKQSELETEKFSEILNDIFTEDQKLHKRYDTFCA
jgi:hypothetical protein